MVGVTGPKGAGKTAVLDCVSGVDRPARGGVWFAGTDVTRLAPHRRATLGMARTFEDNLLAALHRHTGYTSVEGLTGTARTFVGESALRTHVGRVLAFLGLAGQRGMRAGRLSPGLVRRVQIAAAVVAHPRLLVLDEPSAGLTAGEAASLATWLLRVKDGWHLSILLADRYTPLVLSTCDDVYCLEGGRVVAHAAPARIRHHPDFVKALVGEELKETLA